MYYFYIVQCVDGTLYCGQTNNLSRRIREHNEDKNRSAKYTKSRRPVELVYSEPYPTLQLAMKREWQIKKWSRAMKEALIDNKKLNFKIIEQCKESIIITVYDQNSYYGR